MANLYTLESIQDVAFVFSSFGVTLFLFGLVKY